MMKIEKNFRPDETHKNPVAERAVQEMEEELLKLDPMGKSVSNITLAQATNNLNSKIRSRGLSSREMLLQRDQFSNKQIPVSDNQLINEQHEQRLQNHSFSEKSKHPNLNPPVQSDATVGDLVYVNSDLSKSRSRDRYLVTSVDGNWLNIRKFVGSQLRKNTYKVKRHERFKVPYVKQEPNKRSCHLQLSDDETEDISDQTIEPTPPALPKIPDIHQSEQSLQTEENICITQTPEFVAPSDSIPSALNHENIAPIQNDSTEGLLSKYPSRERKAPSFLQMSRNTKSYD